ncbi:MAG: NAD-dependent epimerase/dehydratase family protein [Patescibacteria group bacterium]|nr:NAD-dependent epimerase/dehydratase family protein [Patescibacteria group bacterium]MDE2438433.1 NAD-dependent epimerase/dehydratase family protein [Patescibacteria group bacterium]
MKKALITGAGGLIGSEAVSFFCEQGFDVTGVDNDMRSYFFGPQGSTASRITGLLATYTNFRHHAIDIRDRGKLEELFKTNSFDLIIHTAAQPSHDWAVKEPFTDFTINANGTLHMLEFTRLYSPHAAFIFTSTNKVYGDRPNTLPLVELEKRYEIAEAHPYYKGIDETMSIDDSLHSIFGASKVAADVLVQEYGKYFGMKTAVFRGGCLTGPSHQGVELHGFLNYLVRCILGGKKYTIFGYKGKQVRDNIHSKDLIRAFAAFYEHPRSGEVYNAGGGRQSNCSVLEAIEKIEAASGKKAVYEYVDTHRIGDHIWYISDMSKFKAHYPSWNYEYNLDALIDEMVRATHLNSL